MQRKIARNSRFRSKHSSVLTAFIVSYLAGLALIFAVNCPAQTSNQTAGASSGQGTNAASSLADPLLELMIQKGMVTAEEAQKVRAEADAIRKGTPGLAQESSKWKLGSAIKEIE